MLLVAQDCHPQTTEVIQTRAAPLGIAVRIGTLAELMAVPRRRYLATWGVGHMRL